MRAKYILIGIAAIAAIAFAMFFDVLSTAIANRIADDMESVFSISDIR